MCIDRYVYIYLVSLGTDSIWGWFRGIFSLFYGIYGFFYERGGVRVGGWKEGRDGII